MTLTSSLTRYPSRALLAVAGLLFAALAVRLLVLPLAVVTVLLDRAQAHLTRVAAAMPNSPVHTTPEATTEGGR